MILDVGAVVHLVEFYRVVLHFQILQCRFGALAVRTVRPAENRDRAAVDQFIGVRLDEPIPLLSLCRGVVRRSAHASRKLPAPQVLPAGLAVQAASSHVICGSCRSA
ncbi:hypothetical protein [Streptomyces sp. NPDC091259]|uniref:hypothetical protein n=1 Tax=Streptomyces sp. NPDC091259 TaxID=3365976 RepID=UPI003811727C